METTSVSAKLLSVGEIFAEDSVAYKIPIYQRNYAWGLEQIEQLIDDVRVAAEAGDGQPADYFLGNLIVAEAATSNDTQRRTFEVIDGQQRLTTLFMLLTFLAQTDAGAYSTRPLAHLRYQSRLAATEALAGLTSSDAEEGSGIHTGYNIISQHMDQTVGKGNDRDRFVEYLCSRVKVVRAALPADIDLNRYFEIMNTRGEQLQQVDIVKARLMSYLWSAGGDARAEQECFAWIWDACADMDSYVQMSLTRGNPTLRSRIFGANWDRIETTGFDDLLALRADGPEHGPGAAARVTSLGLSDALTSYARVTRLSEDEDVETTRFKSPVEFPSFLLHTLKVLKGGTLEETEQADDHGQLDDNKLIRLFEAEFRRYTDEERADRVKAFAESLMRCKFVLDNFILKREFTATNGDDGDWSLRRVIARRDRAGKPRAGYANALADGREESEEGLVADVTTREALLLQSMLRVTYTSPRTMHWITAVLRLPVEQMAPSVAGSRIMHVLRRHARSRVREAFPFDAPPTGFQIERIVFTYLDYLLLAEQPDPDFRFTYRNSIEHFFPQHPDREQRGSQQLDDVALHMLGNLALLSVGANSKFSNSMPRYKTGFQQTIRQSPKLMRMAQVAAGEPGWTREAIEQHHREMVELLRADLASENRSSVRRTPTTG